MQDWLALQHRLVHAAADCITHYSVCPKAMVGQLKFAHIELCIVFAHT